VADFDPDAYIAATDPTPPSFDPDAYLKATEPPQSGVEAATAYGQTLGAPTIKEQKRMVSDIPEPIRKPLEAAAETAAGFVPKSVSEVADFATPLVGAVGDIAKAGTSLSNVLFGGQTIDQSVADNYPEAALLTEAEKTPPFSKERYKAGFDVLAQLGTGALIGRGLTPKPVSLSETLGFKEPNPEVTAVNESLAQLEGQPNASEITSPESVTQPEIRTPVGEGTPLRQQGETPEARQGIEAQPQEVALTVSEKPASAALRDVNTGEIWYGEPNHGLLHDKVPNREGRELEAGFATKDGKWISQTQSEELTGMASGDELFEMSPKERTQWFDDQRYQVQNDSSLSKTERANQLSRIDSNEQKAKSWKPPELAAVPEAEAAPKVEIPPDAKATVKFKTDTGDYVSREMNAKEAEGIFTKEKSSYKALIDCLGR